MTDENKSYLLRQSFLSFKHTKRYKLDKYFVANGASGETEEERLNNRKKFPQTNFESIKVSFRRR